MQQARNAKVSNQLHDESKGRSHQPEMRKNQVTYRLWTITYSYFFFMLGEESEEEISNSGLLDLSNRLSQ